MSIECLTRQVFRSVNRVVLPLVRAGVGSPPPIGVGVILMETTGRVSGLPRQVPLLAARLGDRLAVSTIRPGSQWLKNLEAQPSAVLVRGDDRRAVSAMVERGPLNVVTLRPADSA
jgi:hypothetical protein